MRPRVPVALRPVRRFSGASSARFGTRKATSKHVQYQFLIEALILGLASGLKGIAVGAANSYGFAEFLHWPQLLSPVAMAGLAVFSMLIGVFFGYYPAKKAAALDPIEALRFE